MAEADANRTGRGLVVGPHILFRLWPSADSTALACS